MSAELYRKGLELSTSTYVKQGGKQGEKIDFNRSFVDILKDYEQTEKKKVRTTPYPRLRL